MFLWDGDLPYSGEGLFVLSDILEHYNVPIRFQIRKKLGNIQQGLEVCLVKQLSE